MRTNLLTLSKTIREIRHNTIVTHKRYYSVGQINTDLITKY